MAKGVYFGKDNKVNKSKYLIVDIPKIGIKKIKKGCVGTKDGVRIFYISEEWFTKIDNYQTNRELLWEKRGYGMINYFSNTVEFKPYSEYGTNVSNVLTLKYDVSKLHPLGAIEIKIETEIIQISATSEGRPYYYLNINFEDGTTEELGQYTSNQKINISYKVPTGKKVSYLSQSTYVLKKDSEADSTTATIKVNTFKYSYLTEG